HPIWNIHREQNVLNLIRKTFGAQFCEQRSVKIALKFLWRPRDPSSIPAGHSKQILRWNISGFTIIVTELDGVGAVLVDNDYEVQTTPARQGLPCLPNQPNDNQTSD